MSKRGTTSARRAILDDVYRANQGERLSSALIKRRRARRDRTRRRVRGVFTLAKIATLMPLLALAVSWHGGTMGTTTPVTHQPTSHQVAALPVVPLDPDPARFRLRAIKNATGASVAAPSADVAATLALPLREDGPWYAGLSLPTVVTHSADSSEQRADRSASAPGRQWFSGYEHLIDNSSYSMAGLFGLRVKTIVIDAGHGGSDPGAIGPDGLYEKKVTLAVARDLKEKLERIGGYRVLLTRRHDRYVALKRRVQIANNDSADLFISIHVNSLANARKAVAETFYFGPSSSPATLRLVRKENRNSDYNLGDFHQMISRISDTFKRRQSQKLAGLIQKDLYRNIKRHNTRMENAGIHTAPFVVLLGTNMPSVLVEISCISNPLEEHRLSTSDYQNAIAEYLKRGIVAYLNNRSPELHTVNGANEYAGN